MVRSQALRRSAFTLLMASSIGLRSGDTVDPVDWNIVHDHDIAAPERGSETLLHVSEEHWPVHRALDNERRDHCKYFLSSVNRSSWYPWPTLARSEPTRTASAGGQFKSPVACARKFSVTLPLASMPVNRWSGVVRINRGTAGALIAYSAPTCASIAAAPLPRADAGIRPTAPLATS